MTSQRQKQLRSSAACRRRLDDLYMPILERMDNGEFSEEGGSDAYDRAMAELRDAYQATPNLGCMMKEEWETFIRSHALNQVEIEDLDKPDEVTTSQLGTRQPGNDADIRLPSGEVDPEAVRRRMQNMQEEFINSFGDQNTRSKVAKVIKVDNMDAMRNSSSVACGARLEELFQPITDREDRGEYIGEEGHTLYQVHLEDFKREYLDTPDLGVMKGTELDKFIKWLNPTSKLITEYDREATKMAIVEQETIFGLLVKLPELFQQFRETFQKWISSRSDNINWLDFKASSLDEKQKQTKEGILATTWLNGAFTVAGTVVVASLFLVPVTFGASLAVGGVAMGVGISTGIATFAQRKIQRTYDLNAIEEAKKLLLEDKELSENLVSIVKSLESHTEEISKVITARCQQMVGIQIADDVLDAAKMSMAAAKALGAVAAEIGGLSYASDVYTFIETYMNINGSKSMIGVGLRMHAEKMKKHVEDVCRRGQPEEAVVDQAQGALNAVMKRYPLTFGNPDMNSQSTNAQEEETNGISGSQVVEFKQKD